MWNYDWHFERLIPFVPGFLSGIETTLELSVCLIVFATTIGVAVGISLRQRSWWNWPVLVVIDFLKGLPPLVIILFGYFLLSPKMISIDVPAFWAFVFSLGLNVAAFIADLTRAALSNVPQDYIEIGTAIGLRERQLVRFIVFPMAVREIVPPLSYLYIEAVKLTSLASIVSVNEVVYTADGVINNLGRSFEVWIVVGVIYLVLVTPTLYAARLLENRLKREAGVVPSSARPAGY